jgi:magnesium chelatase accessory protein
MPAAPRPMPPGTLPDRWPNRHLSQRVMAHGLDWHVQSAGRGPVALLLHGTAGSTHQWAEVLPALAEHAHVVAIDLPGHGFTQVPPALGRAVFSLAGMAGAVGALLRALHVAPAVIAGHSAGAAVSLRLTLDGHASPGALVGFNPALVPPPAAYTALIAPLLAPLVESRLVAGLAARLATGTGVLDLMLGSSGSTLTPAQRARYRELCGSEAHVAAALTMMSRWDLPALLRDATALRVPFDALAGGRDTWVPLAPLRETVARIPGATFRVVPHAGHLIPDEAPDLAIEAIRDRLPPAAPSDPPPRPTA